MREALLMLQDQNSERIEVFESCQGYSVQPQAEANLEKPLPAPEPRRGWGHAGSVGARQGGCWGSLGPGAPVLREGESWRGWMERKVCVQQGDG